MKKNIGLIIQIGIVVILVGILMFNLGRVSSGGITGNSITSFKDDSGIIPTGTPKIYGNELKVKYDDISTANPRLTDASIGVLGNLDNKITLTGADLDRYIKIASQISCRIYYCKKRGCCSNEPKNRICNKNRANHRRTSQGV